MRYNQILQNMLRKFIDVRGKNWDAFMDRCAFAFNISYQKLTLFTPFKIMSGWQAIILVDRDGKEMSATKILMLKEDGRSEHEGKQICSIIRENVCERVKANITNAWKKQTDEYGKRNANPPRFKDGTFYLKISWENREKVENWITNGLELMR